MSLNKILLLFLAATAMIGSMGCNNKKSSTPPPPACPVGQIATPAGCTPPGNVVPPVGFIPPPMSNSGPLQYYASKTDFLSPNDTLFPTDNYDNFLKDALGVCERCTNSGGEILECNSWVNGFNMLMVSFAGAFTLNHQMAFYTTPKLSNPYFQYAWQFPDLGDFFLTLFTGIAPPSCNPGQYSPYWAADAQFKSINTDQGFELAIDHGPYYSRWNLYKFRLDVPVGKIGDPNFNFKLTVIDKEGRTATLATGTLTRCQTMNCSMF